MRASDIVNQLAVFLPRLVDDFTDTVAIDSITQAGGVATVTTPTDHGFAVGQQVNIVGAQTPIAISSIDRNGIVGTLVTDADHDLTENAGFDVQIEGATEPEFNGTFTLLSVPNRRTITFQMPDSGPTTATGSPLLLNGSNVFQNYNGLQEITAVPSTTTFEYPVDPSLFSPAAGSPEARAGIRISAALTIDRIIEAYTKQSPDDAWLFVVLGDALADKSRRIDTDATDNIQAGNYFNQRLIQNLQIFVMLPTAEQIAGRKARDRCEELLSPICQCLLTAKFPSLVENTNNPLMITGHGLQAYNTAFYVHQYNFEATLQLGPSDTYRPDDDVAFRDIDLTQAFSVGTGEIDSLIDLDDEPLP